MNKTSFLILFVLLIYSFFVISSLKKPFFSDELDFVKPAQGVVKTGLPFEYRDETSPYFPFSFHIPFFIYVLAGSFSLFGINEITARIVPFTFNILTIISIIFILKHLKKSNTSILFAVLIFCLSSLIIQGSLLLDIDNSLLMFLFSIFVLLFLKSVDKKFSISTKNLLLLGAVFGLSLLAKIGSSPLLPISIAIIYLLNKMILKGLKYSILIGLEGLIILFAVWYPYSLLTNIPFLDPFEHNLIGGVVSSISNFKLHVEHVIFTSLSFIRWLTPPLSILLILFYISRSFNFIKSGKIYPEDMIAVLPFILISFYLFVVAGAPYGFPKYFYPAMPFVCILVASLFDNLIFKMKELFPYALLFSLIFLYSLLIIGDPLLLDIRLEQRFLEIFKNMLLYSLPTIILIPTLCLVKKISFTKSIALSCLLSFIPLCIFINYLQLNADYSTNYDYGTKGIIATAEFVKSHTSPDSVIFSQKEIAYYSNRKYFYISRSTIVEDLNKYNSWIDQNKIRFITITPFIVAKDEKVSSFLSQYELTKTIGSYYIYDTKIS